MAARAMLLALMQLPLALGALTAERHDALQMELMAAKSTSTHHSSSHSTSTKKVPSTPTLKVPKECDTFDCGWTMGAPIITRRPRPPLPSVATAAR